MNRREYKINLLINRRRITKAVIDPHYEVRHKDSITDKIILDLLLKLDNRLFSPVKTHDGFEYYVEDKVKHKGNLYKLVWLLQDDEVFIGVLNCYRRD